MKDQGKVQAEDGNEAEHAGGDLRPQNGQMSARGYYSNRGFEAGAVPGRMSRRVFESKSSPNKSE